MLCHATLYYITLHLTILFSPARRGVRAGGKEITLRRPGQKDTLRSLGDVEVTRAYVFGHDISIIATINMMYQFYIIAICYTIYLYIIIAIFIVAIVILLYDYNRAVGQHVQGRCRGPQDGRRRPHPRTYAFQHARLAYFYS